MANQLVTIFWRDIPSQVNAQAGRTRHPVTLSERFQLAIDRAAMVSGKAGSDDYINEWRRVSQPCGEDLAAAATSEAERLEAAYDQLRLASLATNGGVELE
jgi:Virulence factor